MRLREKYDVPSPEISKAYLSKIVYVCIRYTGRKYLSLIKMKLKVRYIGFLTGNNLILLIFSKSFICGISHNRNFHISVRSHVK